MRTTRISMGMVSLVLIGAVVTGCGDSADDDGDMGAGETTQSLEATFDGLPDLGADYTYEGWLIVDGTPVSAGRFDATDQVSYDLEADQSDASAYVLTIEPTEGDMPTPSKTHLLGGPITDGQADLTAGADSALGTSFDGAAGQFILAAPTAAMGADAGDQGIWYLDPSGPSATLELPALPDGWIYEGWVVGDDGPVSTGRFSAVDMADSDMAGPAAGPNGGKPFPGQDFVDPAMSLIGATAVISVEPDPDTSAAPFAIKPLTGPITDAGKGALQMLDPNDAALPSGEVHMMTK